MIAKPVCFDETQVALLKDVVTLTRRGARHPLLVIPRSFIHQKDAAGKTLPDLIPDAHRRLYDAYAAIVDEDMTRRLLTTETLEEE